MCEHHRALGIATESDLPPLPALTVSSDGLAFSGVEPTSKLTETGAGARDAIHGILARARTDEPRLSGDAKKKWQDGIMGQLAQAVGHVIPPRGLDGRNKTQTIVNLRQALLELAPDIELPAFIRNTQARGRRGTH